MSPEQTLKRAAERYADAKAGRDQAIREAVAAGLSLRQIAAIVDLSHQRVHQIVNA